ncbi:TPA: hypothetical protein ACH3X1_006245 [Trebouxia sp. C0004]
MSGVTTRYTLLQRSTDTALIVHRVAAFIRWVARRLHCLSGTAPVIVAPLPNYTAMQRRTNPTTCRGIMATRQARRAANKEGSIYSMKTGFKQIFTDARLAAITLQAVQLVTPY